MWTIGCVDNSHYKWTQLSTVYSVMFEGLIFYGRHVGKDCHDYIFNACYYPVYGMFTDKGNLIMKISWTV